ncbi:MAG TPA: lipase maturation factor family protein [Terriglobia bacterium]|nr:lipase maturation factor family protein [Terriglobia bacterium]
MTGNASNLPLLVYDGDCSFCRFWIDAWKARTGERVVYAPYQEVASRLPRIPVANFRKAVQLILPDGKVFSGAEAVFGTLATAPGAGWMLTVYQRVPGFAPVSEACYRVVAAHRDFFYWFTRLGWGRRYTPGSHALTRWLFLRWMGVVYLIAFASFGVQLRGLIGARGILPAAHFLSAVGRDFGSERYQLFPTLAWLDSSDRFLGFLAWGGVIFSLLIILGIATGPSLAGAWVFYLSLVTVGGDFMSFQWDILLLEAGFLAIFFAPWTWFEPPWHPPRASSPSKTVLWLLRWLLFRLLFLSGTVKLQSGDPTWRHLTALEYHYYTQPLPTPIAWYMNQLPAWFQELSVVFVFAVEIGVPFLIFFPRRLRLTGAALIASLEILIALTGNYTFFNLLALVLCLLLLDDAFLARFVPRRLAQRIAGVGEQPGPFRLRRAITVALAVVILTASGAELAGRFLRGVVPRPARHLLGLLEPFHIVNGYGLFAVMTTSRLEIIVQGSNDGTTWRDYEFKYKPGDVKRPPPWVAPHQPRLDWQMWFAALGNFQENPWFVNFMARLLEGSPEVLALLERNPFPAAPPRYVRALIYDYHFTDFAERRATGAWWHRELKAMYFPQVSLSDLQ